MPAQNSKAVRGSLESRYRGARTLKAEFFQRYSDGSGGVSAESGVVYFSRPGRMRWEYESPEQKLFLVDGANAWFYVPADHTASRAKIRESSDWRTPLALLASKTDLSKLCRKIELAGDSPSSKDWTCNQRLVMPCCVACPEDRKKKELRLQTCFWKWTATDGLRGSLSTTTGNAQTEFRFGNWAENLPIPEAKFHFQPPPGVAIVDEESLAGEVH